ncbi:MAG: polysaccharide deacetylase family protein [Chloroflexota bacterium]
MAQPIPILLYHFVNDTVPSGATRWNMPPDRFEAHIKHFREQQYTPLTVSAYVDLLTNEPKKLPKRPLLVTFDDGTADFHANVLPILQKYNFPVTLYITTKYIGDTTRWLIGAGAGNMPMLTWQQVRDIQASGLVEIGAHTETHPQLDIIPATAAVNEIVGSKRALETQLGQPVQSFAYPHGFHKTAVRQAVIDANFSSACAVKNALSAIHDDRFALSRITIEIDMSIEKVEGLMAGEGMRLAPQQERLETTLFRWYRWIRHALRARFAFNQDHHYATANVHSYNSTDPRQKG